MLPSAIVLLLALSARAPAPLPDGVAMRLGTASGIRIDTEAAFSPDGKRLATSPRLGEVCVWDAVAGKLLCTHHADDYIFHLAWMPDGKLVGIREWTFEVMLYGWADEKDAGLTEQGMKEVRKASNVVPNDPRVQRFALSPDGRRVAVLSDGESGRVAVYPVSLNTSTKLLKPEVTIPLRDGEFVGFSEDSNTLFTIVPNRTRGDRVSAFNLISKKPEEAAWVLELPREADREEVQDGKKVTVKGKGFPAGAYSRDGKRVVLEHCDPNGILEVWDGPKGKKLHSWAAPPYSFYFPERAVIALAPDGKRLAVSVREKGGLVGGAVYDLDTGKEAAKLVAGPSVRGLEGLKYSPDGKRLYRQYQVWDAETGDNLTPAGHHGGVNSVLVSGDGKTIVTSGEDFTARGWDAKTGEQKWRADFPYPVRSLRRLNGDVAVATEGEYRALPQPLLDLNTGKLSPLPGGMAKERTVKIGVMNHVVQSPPVAISPDGKTVVSVDIKSPALEVWDWPAGKLRATLKFDPPAKMVLQDTAGVSFSADGKELVGVFRYTDKKPDAGDWLTYRGQDCLERWDVARSTQVERITYEKHTSAALVAYGKREVVLRSGKVVDAFTGEKLPTPTDEEKHPLSLATAALSADGNTLAGWGWSGRHEIRWYDLTTGKLLASRQVKAMEFAFLPDGRLVSGGDEALVWNAVK